MKIGVLAVGTPIVLAVGAVAAGIIIYLAGLISEPLGNSCLAVASESCVSSSQPIFYIPQMNLGYDEGCNPITIDETNNQVALYRFSISSDVSQDTLNDWYINQIKTKVGNGFLYLGATSCGGDYYQAATDTQPIIVSSYSTACSGNVCDKIIDNNLPPNSYVVYVAKMLGDYTGADGSYPSGCVSVTKPNKFLNKDNNVRTSFPISCSLGNAILDNAIIGPLKTCPSLPTMPTIDFRGPTQVEVPDPIVLYWATENADSCVASGDWSGSKQVGPLPYKTESLSKPRGNYNFILTCSGSGGAASSTVSTTVVQLPHCSFTANPTSIIPPQTSTLSWSCQYAESCSINQGIGSVNNVSGTKQVRPTSTTAYTLTCSGLDGSRSFPATVTVSFMPKWEEVLPR